MASTLALNQFKPYESESKVNADTLIALVRGEIPTYVIRSMFSKQECDAVYGAFTSIHTTKRTDQVPGIHLGAFHYGKTTKEYFDAVDATAAETNSLLMGTNGPIRVLHKHFQSALQRKGIEYRAAAWRGRMASDFVARSWSGDGKFALSPHEDLAQLRHPSQRDFEIQAVAQSTIVGVNVCIHASEVGGALRVWNLIPDDGDRTRLGVEYSGYPYPIEFANAEDSFTVCPCIGDIYCVNGNLLHAVERQTGGGARVVLSFACGFIDSETVVYWT